MMKMMDYPFIHGMPGVNTIAIQYGKLNLYMMNAPSIANVLLAAIESYRKRLNSYSFNVMMHRKRQ